MQSEPGRIDDDKILIENLVVHRSGTRLRAIEHCGQALDQRLGHSGFVPSINGVSGSKIVFPNVLWVPVLANNLISTTSLVESEGYTQQYDKKGMRFYKDGGLRFTATVREMKVATLDGHFLSSSNDVALSVTTPTASLETWYLGPTHERLAAYTITSARCLTM